MASISIVQDNRDEAFNLVSINNPLVFICEVEYDGLTPDYLETELLKEGVVVGTFKAISYKDTAPQTRQYYFKADDIIKSFLTDFKDFAQGANTTIFVPNITAQFSVKFKYEALTAQCDFTACNAVRQFGNSTGAEMTDINNATIYTAGEGGVVYIYFYNWDENNVISFDSPGLISGYALDWNSDIFTDQNLDRFTIIN